jgi:hypothetical protein
MQVRDFADNALLLRLARSDQVANYYQSCSDADTSLKRACCLQSSDRSNQLQPGPYGSLSIVRMSLRIAEIEENAVAHATDF